MKKIITRTIDFNLDWDGTIPIENIRKNLNSIEELGATHVKFDIDQYPNISYLEINPIVIREENDEEYKNRLDYENSVKLKKENEERQLLDKLKKKYENG